MIIGLDPGTEQSAVVIIDRDKNVRTRFIDTNEEVLARLVVRAMHDGHCPSCGYLGPAENFWADEKSHPSCAEDEGHHQCPVHGGKLDKLTF